MVPIPYRPKLRYSPCASSPSCRQSPIRLLHLMPPEVYPTIFCGSEDSHTEPYKLLLSERTSPSGNSPTLPFLISLRPSHLDTVTRKSRVSRPQADFGKFVR